MPSRANYVVGSIRIAFRKAVKLKKMLWKDEKSLSKVYINYIHQADLKKKNNCSNILFKQITEIGLENHQN